MIIIRRLLHGNLFEHAVYLLAQAAPDTDLAAVYAKRIAPLKRRILRIKSG